MAAIEELYRRYADLALDVGLSLQAGQRLWLSMPVTAAPLARVIAAAAYQRGARYVRERTFHPTQQLHDLPDGGVELRFKAAGLELPRFVLEWGPRVEVIEPAWLREDVINQLRTALARYSDHQGDRRTVSDRVMGNSRTGTTET